jgi:hypothetical protein
MIPGISVGTTGHPICIFLQDSGVAQEARKWTCSCVVQVAQLPAKYSAFGRVHNLLLLNPEKQNEETMEPQTQETVRLYFKIEDLSGC